MCLCCVRVYYDVYFVLIENSILFFLHTLKMEVEERRLFFAPFSGDVSKGQTSPNLLIFYYCITVVSSMHVVPQWGCCRGLW